MNQEIIAENHEIVLKYFGIFLSWQDIRTFPQKNLLGKLYNSLVNWYTVQMKEDKCSKEEIKDFLSQAEKIQKENEKLLNDTNSENL